ncbi:hypothetical protein N800_12810 [Lysobacter daejeonensis GH1-9]|uniref:Uncharacterized protein n=1 Tax=Lysobacter daejeonensis GH1-9 TaxID=1385517 RepID=A0A0A0EZ61_9GAMM|nr:hypothetical protein [Lysobacter daejeonensis]KGM55595.1 hypothetical protein N800_12810 [Lysobacter daejeonensis GH1-9]
MRLNVSMGRVVAGSVVLAAVVAGSGCGWWRKSNKLYGDDVAARPLEVPPELDRSSAASTGSATASSVVGGTQPKPAGAAVGAAGFTMSGTRDEAFTKVGEALATVEGVTIASRAQLLGAFDVNYEGSNFLVRVTAVEAGAYVSAVDPRGVPATGEAPAKLIASVKQAVGGR